MEAFKLDNFEDKMLGFNRCRKCGYWMDEAFDKFEEEESICEDCAEKEEED